jgi:hypothetical protein
VLQLTKWPILFCFPILDSLFINTRSRFLLLINAPPLAIVEVRGDNVVSGKCTIRISEVRINGILLCILMQISMSYATITFDANSMFYFGRGV